VAAYRSIENASVGGSQSIDADNYEAFTSLESQGQLTNQFREEMTSRTSVKSSANSFVPPRAMV
jgi:hypothetical protein